VDETQEQSSGQPEDRQRGPAIGSGDASLWLAALVNSSDNAIISKTLDGIVTSWNAAAQHIYGYSSEEIVGKSISLLIPPDRLDEFDQIMRRLRRGERIGHFETVRVRRDGTHVDVSVTISPIVDAQGQIIGASTIARDITERKRAEAELLALKNRLTADLSAMTHLHELGSRLVATSELQPLLQEALDTSIGFLGADFGTIQLYNPETSALEIAVQHGFDQAFLDYFSRVDDDHTACGRAVRYGERVVIEDLELDAGFAPHRTIAAASGFRAVQSTPLRNYAGELLGMFSTHFRQPHQFSERELRLTDLYARQATEMISFTLGQEQLGRAHDELEAEVAKRTHELRMFASLIENSLDFVGIASAEGQVLFVNLAGQEMVGLDGDAQARATKILDYVAEHEQERVQNDLLPTVVQAGRWEGEIVFRHFKTGAPISMWLHLFFITESGSDRRIALAVIGRDITERRRAEQDRRRVMEQLVNAQEEERRRIARELHDSLGQHLMALHLGLKSAQAQANVPPNIAGILHQLRELALRIDDEIDHISFELRPPSLDDLGLAAALRLLIKEWSATSSILVDWHTGQLDNWRLPPTVETTVYRIVQEALTNIHKHAQATHVSLIVERRDAEVLAIIEDNGQGFDIESMAQAPNTGRKLGLRGMEERAALASGQLDVETAPGAGTTVYLRIPIPAGAGDGGSTADG
jgi:PAS domain S-box-containing protein